MDVIKNKCIQIRNLIAKRYVIAFLMSFGFFIARGTSSHVLYSWDFSDFWIADNKTFPLSFEDAYQILDANTYASLSSTILGGFLSCKYSSKKIFGIAICGTSLLHLIMPFSINLGKSTAIFVSVLKGVLEGLVLPSMHGIWRFWAPPKEITLLVPIALFGFYLDLFANFGIALFLMHSTNMWSSIFYIYGAFGIVWAILWFWMVYDKPSSHPSITYVETVYLENSIDFSPIRFQKIQWISIIKSKPVISLMIASFCCGWNISVALVLLRQFFIQIYSFSVTHSFSNLTLALAIGIPISGVVAYIIIKYTTVNKSLVMKISIGGSLIAIGAVLPFIGIYNSEHIFVNYMLWILLIGFQSIVIMGVSTNQLDIAPRYAGLLMGFSYWLEQMAYSIHNNIIVAIDQNNITHEDWKYVVNILFTIAITLNVFCGFFYIAFGAGKKQKWADDIIKPEISKVMFMGHPDTVQIQPAAFAD